jgi:hypothetical protein
MAKKDTEEVVVTEERFEKSQLIASKRYSKLQDVLNAILVDGQTYTITDTENLINKFMKGKVN